MTSASITVSSTTSLNCNDPIAPVSKAIVVASNSIPTSGAVAQYNRGRNSVDELTDSHLHIAYSQMDKNKDGRVSRAEMITALRGNDSMRAMLNLPSTFRYASGKGMRTGKV